MLVLERIKLQNFRCFKDLDLAIPASGIHLLTGQNQQDPDNTTNGIGKTSIFDAICFGLYGVTAKGKKGRALLNYNSGATSYSVELVFNKFTVRRTWSPITVQLIYPGVIPREVHQQELNDLIGLSQEQFQQVCYFKHTNAHFIHMTPATKMQFLSTVFDLDRWLKLADKCKLRLTHLYGTQVHTKGAFTSVSDQAALLSEQLAKLENSSVEWSAKELQRRDLLSMQLTTAMSDFQGWQHSTSVILQSLTNKLNNIQDLYRTPSTRYEYLIQGTTKDIREYKRMIEVLSTEKQQLKQWEHHAALREQSLLTLKCLTCKTSIAGDAQQLEWVQADLEGTRRARRKLSTKIQELKRTVSTWEHSIEYWGDQLRKVQVIEFEETRLTSEIEKLSQQTNPHAATVAHLESQLAVQESNPFESLVASTQAKLIQTIERAEQLQHEMQELASTIADWEFWQSEFPKIRFEELTQVVDELNIYLNKALSDLGMSSWSIRFDTTRELKSTDAIKQELNIGITRDGKSIDLDTLSDGEMHRVLHACTFGIGDLIRARTNCQLTLRLLDEPCAFGVSERGVDMLFSYLQKYATTSSILVAEHRVGHLITFDSTIKLTKDATGISTVMA